MFMLQSVARGGVSVNVIFEYQIVGSGEGRLCPNCATGPPAYQEGAFHWFGGFVEGHSPPQLANV